MEDTTIELECRRCGDCCRKHGLYPVTSSDIADIALYTGVEVDELLSKFCIVTTHDGRKGLFTRGTGMACPFLAGDTCSIHAFKPLVCSIFPDNDGHVTVRRLKDCLRASVTHGEGLSRCAIWDMADDGILAPAIEATARFRIREDTDAQYFLAMTALTRTLSNTFPGWQSSGRPTCRSTWRRRGNTACCGSSIQPVCGIRRRSCRPSATSCTAIAAPMPRQTCCRRPSSSARVYERRS